MRDGAACTEVKGPELTEERLVVEGLGLASATTTEVSSHD
jgi:hypothetical protein